MGGNPELASWGFPPPTVFAEGRVIQSIRPVTAIIASARSSRKFSRAAATAKLGRLDEARAAAARVLQLQPTFRYSRQFAGVGGAPALAAKMAEALSAAGLPE